MPVSKTVPPVAFAYQFILPSEVVAPNTMVPAPQVDPGVVEVICGFITVIFLAAELEEVDPK